MDEHVAANLAPNFEAVLRGVAPATSISTPHGQVAEFSMFKPIRSRLMNSTLR